MLARRTNIEIIYEGVNISSYISNDLLSFSYTDNASGSADDISITLKDDKKRWLKEWQPKKVDRIKVFIKTTNWRYEGDSQILNCGAFMVDEPSYTGRPVTLSLGAISVPANSDFMNIKNSRSWNSVAVKEIASTIAKDTGLELLYDTEYNPIIGFVEQSEKTNSAFLSEICSKNGLAIKVYNNKLVIFRELEYENKQSIGTIFETNMMTWNAKTTFTDTGYDGCMVSYTDPYSGEVYKYTFRVPGKTGNKIYKVNDNVNSYAEAERLAKSKIRELNKKEYTISITIPGNINMIASCCVNIEDLGAFDGKYYIDKATHNIGSGYTTQLELHKVLEGY